MKTNPPSPERESRHALDILWFDFLCTNAGTMPEVWFKEA